MLLFELQKALNPKISDIELGNLNQFESIVSIVNFNRIGVKWASVTSKGQNLLISDDFLITQIIREVFLNEFLAILNCILFNRRL